MDKDNSLNKVNKSLKLQEKSKIYIDKEFETISKKLLSKIKLDCHPFDVYSISDVSELAIRPSDDGFILVFEAKYDNFLEQLNWEYFTNYELWFNTKKLKNLKEENYKKETFINVAKKLNLC